MWDELGYSDFNVWLSKLLPEFYILGMGNFQVAILLLTGIGGWFVTGWISLLIAGLGGRFTNPWQHALSRFLRVPLRLILYVLLIRIVIANLGLSVIAKAYLQSSPLEYLVAVILAFGLLNLYRDYKIRQLELQGDIEYVALIKPVAVILRIVIATTAALMWADRGFHYQDRKDVSSLGANRVCSYVGRCHRIDTTRYAPLGLWRSLFIPRGL